MITIIFINSSANQGKTMYIKNNNAPMVRIATIE